MVTDLWSLEVIKKEREALKEAAKEAEKKAKEEARLKKEEEKRVKKEEERKKKEKEKVWIFIYWEMLQFTLPKSLHFVLNFGRQTLLTKLWNFR